MTRKLLLAGLAAALATPLFAQTPAPLPAPKPVPFVQHAPMVDRVVLRSELDAQVRQHFAQMDANRDGFVTKDEAMSRAGGHRMMMHGQPGEHGKRVVLEHRMDGKPGEHGGPAVAFRERLDGPGAADANAAFDRLDTNRDGQISRDEFGKGRTIRIEKRIAMKDGKGPRGARHFRHMRGPGGHGLVAGAMIRMIDNDKDGRISLAEATAGTLQHFDRVDTNRDGRLTPEERRAGRAIMREVRQQRRAG